MAFSFAAEIHFVHWNTDFGTVEAALAEKKGLAVLGFFISTSGSAPGGASLLKVDFQNLYCAMFYRVRQKKMSNSTVEHAQLIMKRS